MTYFIKAMSFKEAKETVWKNFYRGALGYSFYEAKEGPLKYILFAGAPLKIRRRYYV